MENIVIELMDGVRDLTAQEIFSVGAMESNDAPVPIVLAFDGPIDSVTEAIDAIRPMLLRRGWEAVGVIAMPHMPTIVNWRAGGCGFGSYPKSQVGWRCPLSAINDLIVGHVRPYDAPSCRVQIWDMTHQAGGPK